MANPVQPQRASRGGRRMGTSTKWVDSRASSHAIDCVEVGHDQILVVELRSMYLSSCHWVHAVHAASDATVASGCQWVERAVLRQSTLGRPNWQARPFQRACKVGGGVGAQRAVSSTHTTSGPPTSIYPAVDLTVVVCLYYIFSSFPHLSLPDPNLHTTSTLRSLESLSSASMPP